MCWTAGCKILRDAFLQGPPVKPAAGVDRPRNLRPPTIQMHAHVLTFVTFPAVHIDVS